MTHDTTKAPHGAALSGDANASRWKVRSGIDLKTLKVKEAVRQIPETEIENAACELLDEIRDEFEVIDSDDYAKALDIIKKHLKWMIDTALTNLEPVAIVGFSEDDDVQD